MRLVIGIILVVLLAAALVGYLILVLNTEQMIYCGDISSQDSSRNYITRIYTTDLSADEVLGEIVTTMSSTVEDSVPVDELTRILATYQDIIYAPVFALDLQQIDESTCVLTGSVYNGLKDNGEPAETEYVYRNMGLAAGITNGAVVAAQNVYPLVESKNGEIEFQTRREVVDPIITDNGTGAAFAFKDCDSFRLVFTETDELTASLSLAYTYDVVAVSPFDFTSVDGGVMYLTVEIAYNDDGVLTPVYTLERGTVQVVG